MTFTFNSNSKQKNRLRPLGGFTLVEMMVTLTLSLMVMSGLSESYLFMIKSSISLGNYADMNTQTRIGLEKFARDIRMATNVFTINSNNIDFDVPKVGGGFTAITYSYNSTNKTVSRIVGGGGGTQVILRDVQNFSIKYYDHLGNTTTSLTFVKRVQLDLTMRRNVLTLENNNHVISAHYMMRMKSSV